MIITYFSEIWPAVARAIVNHLWQSTLFAIIAGALTLSLRKNRARARYGLWLAASVKFLVPFSLLVSLGSHLAKPSVGAGAQVASGLYAAVQEVSQVAQTSIFEVCGPSCGRTADLKGAGPRYRLRHLLPAVLGVAWLCGFVAVLLVWLLRWRRIWAALREATPMPAGREVEALRRLERVAGMRKRIAMLESRASLEPGIFGIVRPILVWPEGISEHLDDAQLESIVAHEVWHARRRDNLAAAVHMAVEALFWFHPLVWWLGARLVQERERACDEEVLQLGNQPRVYAESILKACEFCVASPLACVSGVAGPDLQKRMVRIMTGHAVRKLEARKKLLLAVAAFLAVGAPIGFGLARGQAGQANEPQSAASSPAENPLAKTAKFEVASIKRSKPSGPAIMFRIMNSSNDGRFYADGPTVRMLLRMAYDVQDAQIVGGPSWINSERFDIQAKADSSVDEELRKLSLEQAKLVKEHMLQELLADRFKLTLHHETRELPVYALVVAKNGPKLEEVKDDTSRPAGSGTPGGPLPNRGVRMQIAGGGEQRMEVQGSPISFLATLLAQSLGRTVVDETGLKGNYKFSLHWVPEMGGGPMMGGPPPGGPAVTVGGAGAGGAVAVAGPGGNQPPAMGAPSTLDNSGPSIFTALEEQIGLKLRLEKGPVDVVVIDRVEEPSEN